MRVTRGLSGSGATSAGEAAQLALTIGNFDGVHRAHLAMIERTVDAAADLGLTPAVLTFHPSPKEFFARQAGLPVAARLSTLADKLQRFRDAGVERVVIAQFNAKLSKLSPEAFIDDVLVDHLQVRWLLVGDDFRFGHKRGGTIATLRAAKSFTVEQMHTVTLDGHRVSSTGVRSALKDGDLGTAEHLLGRPYSICGRVVHGQKLGRAIGFPTANIPLRFVPPLSGIFVVRVAGLGAVPRYGVASLGLRPTVNALTRPMLEVFLFDFDQPIYGRRIDVTFLSKLRDEAKYPDLETLSAQIRRDADAARTYLARIGAVEKAA